MITTRKKMVRMITHYKCLVSKHPFIISGQPSVFHFDDKNGVDSGFESNEDDYAEDDLELGDHW
jgi:hypothetical protein